MILFKIVKLSPVRMYLLWLLFTGREIKDFVALSLSESCGRSSEKNSASAEVHVIMKIFLSPVTSVINSGNFLSICRSKYCDFIFLF